MMASGSNTFGANNQGKDQLIKLMSKYNGYRINMENMTGDKLSSIKVDIGQFAHPVMLKWMG